MSLISDQVKATAENVDEAVRELPDANSVRYSSLFRLIMPFLLRGINSKLLKYSKLTLPCLKLFPLVVLHILYKWRMWLIVVQTSRLIEFTYCTIFQRPEDLWAIHSHPVFPKPHKKDSSSWVAIQKVTIYKFKISFFNL